jgi:non-specific serine/threonine protein kinase
LRTLWDAIPARLFRHYVRYHEACLADVRSAVGEARFERLTRDGAELSTNQLVACALEEEEEEAAAEEAFVRVTYPELTRRESEIARLVAQGLTNRGIASKLVISQRTAETHVEHILTKLGFTSRAQIAAWVVEEEARSGSRR